MHTQSCTCCASEWGDDVSIADVAAGRAATRVNDMTVCCATDGNHGLAVAWGARRAGAKL